MAPPREKRQLLLNDPAYQTRQTYDLRKEELDEIRREKLYPFFDRDSEGKRGDLVPEINDNSAQVQKQLNFLLPFYGFGFNYTWVRHFSFQFIPESTLKYWFGLDFNPRLSWIQ